RDHPQPPPRTRAVVPALARPVHSREAAYRQTALRPARPREVARYRPGAEVCLRGERPQRGGTAQRPPRASVRHVPSDRGSRPDADRPDHYRSPVARTLGNEGQPEGGGDDGPARERGHGARSGAPAASEAVTWRETAIRVRRNVEGSGERGARDRADVSPLTSKASPRFGER